MSLTALDLREAVRPLVDLVYPPRCPCCGVPIGAQTGLCTDCWNSLVLPSDPLCSLCQCPLPGEHVQEASRCAACLAQPPRHDGVAAAVLYTEVSRKLVLAFKHGRRLALARLLARMIAARLPDGEGSALLVPVPLHRWRLWRRGFNQAAVLARELERIGRGTLLVDGLIRRKATPSLGGMGARARGRALSGAIAVRSGAIDRVRGRHVVLVDDVLTSGATSDACVRALKSAGAARVTVACFARVIDRHERSNETPGTTKVPGAA